VRPTTGKIPVNRGAIGPSRITLACSVIRSRSESRRADNQDTRTARLCGSTWSTPRVSKTTENERAICVSCWSKMWRMRRVSASLWRPHMTAPHSFFDAHQTNDEPVTA
jgi:hypothetical protein